MNFRTREIGGKLEGIILIILVLNKGIPKGNFLRFSHKIFLLKKFRSKTAGDEIFLVQLKKFRKCQGFLQKIEKEIIITGSNLPPVPTPPKMGQQGKLLEVIIVIFQFIWSLPTLVRTRRDANSCLFVFLLVFSHFFTVCFFVFCRFYYFCCFYSFLWFVIVLVFFFYCFFLSKLPNNKYQ